MGRARPLLLATALLVAAVDTAAARVQDVTRRQEQLSACADDMQRLCPGDLSVSQKLKTCIRPRRASVSPKCRAWLDVPE